MRFKVDENLPVDIAELLRPAEHDVTTVHEQKLMGEADLRILEVCRDEERTLITLDMDFANVRAYPPAQHPGIVVLRVARQESLTCWLSFEQHCRCWNTIHYSITCGFSKRAG